MQRAFLFMIVGHLYMGILHVKMEPLCCFRSLYYADKIQITLSHWERPMLLVDDQHEWVRVQVQTSRNIHPGTFNDWYYGGLHYQIEHHLFPRSVLVVLPRAVSKFAHAVCRDTIWPRSRLRCCPFARSGTFRIAPAPRGRPSRCVCRNALLRTRSQHTHIAGRLQQSFGRCQASEKVRRPREGAQMKFTDAASIVLKRVLKQLWCLRLR